MGYVRHHKTFGELFGEYVADLNVRLLDNLKGVGAPGKQMTGNTPPPSPRGGMGGTEATVPPRRKQISFGSSAKAKKYFPY